MSAIDVDVLKHVLCLQVRLYVCRERLAAATDSEALHDLRVALRQLRSLLRPLRGLALCDELSEAAAEFGRLSGPVRDLEVLQAHLRKIGMGDAADARQARLRASYTGLMRSRCLARLFSLLDQWPESWRDAALQQAAFLEKRVEKQLKKDRQRLSSALHEKLTDRHRLRLLIKRLRYVTEAYSTAPEQSTQAILKRAQSALGDWHDRLQWLERAKTEADLQPCVAAWQRAMLQAQKQADEVLAELLSEPAFSRCSD